MKEELIHNAEVISFTTPASKCVYLHDRPMRMDYKYIKNCSFELCSSLTKRGWRRFGEYFSRPICGNCKECLSIKIDVNEFKLGRSAKRVYKRCTKEIDEIIIQKPTYCDEHLILHEKYHDHMRMKKNWKNYEVTKKSFLELYINGASNFGKEVLYIKDSKVIGIDFIDILDDGISSIYFFYDPDFSYLGLGNFSMYKQFEFAKELNLRWIYIGYYVKDCNSLNYKSKYKPYYILVNEPRLNEADIWQLHQ